MTRPHSLERTRTSAWRVLFAALPLGGLVDCSHDFGFLSRAESGRAGTPARAGAPSANGGGRGGDAGTGALAGAGTRGDSSERAAGGRGHDGGEAGDSFTAGGGRDAPGGGGGDLGGAGVTRGTAGGGGENSSVPAAGGAGGAVPDECADVPDFCPEPFTCVKDDVCEVTWDGTVPRMVLNGNAWVDELHAVVLTDDTGAHEVSSAFTSDRYSVRHFRFTFDFYVAPSGSADLGYGFPQGFTLTLQRAGANALGQPDESLGYSGIPSSVALAIGIIGSSVAVAQGGERIPGGATFTALNYLDTPVSVEVAYDGRTLTAALSNSAGGESAAWSWDLDIPAAVGGDDAYFGFTGASGSDVALQRIDDFVLSVLP
ncbi:MAG TPA: hypothetical protein VMI54_14235 [Polyangiaceae bacterium]|nr:hypothetical protein [Polyangiaceae bacterium]